MLSLLLKTLSREFYRQHLGLFCFALYILFGSVEAGQLLSYHLSLLRSISGSTIILAACFVLWSLYAIKCILFVNKELKLDVYSFINVSAAATKRSQYLSWSGLYATLLLPILTYITIVSTTAFIYHYYFNAAMALVFALLLVITPTVLTFRKVTQNLSIRLKVRFVKIPTFVKPQWLWPIVYIWRQQTLMFLICKTLSFIVFKAMLWMFADVGPDIRVPQLGLLAAIITHSVLIATLVKQEATDMNFNRSLPINRFNAMGRSLLVLFLLFLPDLLLYIHTVNADFTSSLAGIALALPTLFCIQVSQYKNTEKKSSHVGLLFFMFVALAMLILSRQLFLFNCLQALVSCTGFYIFYYSIDLRAIRNH
ncbi:hypothetical protein [Pedobacter duraquae]|uniref:Uncharacterized protein n=1 Tax=Pedobacter duraquae TaxID=425511 RepID=A0A4R6ICL4_9SPHI|nr:hypothetical protein [Pedobacter duraquae]TDO19594.1 hypothetical protein CLV32_4216 [Pedobacter duraquae]